MERRNDLARTAVNWMQVQFDFAVDAANDPQATPPSKSLMDCLKLNPELDFVKSLPGDTRIAAEIRAELSRLLVAIDQAKTTSTTSDH